MNRNLRLIGILTITMLLTPFFSLRALAARTYPSEAWMGMYVSSFKIGYSRFFVDRADFEGKPGYRMENTSVVKVAVLGSDVEQNINTVIHLNEKYEPVHEVFKMSSGGVSTTVTARFTPTEITAEMDSGGSKSTQKIPIPPGSKLLADDSGVFGPDAKLKVGDRMTFKSFNPLTLTLDDIQVEVLRTEELVLADGKHRCFVVKSTTPLGSATSWEDENDDVLKVEMEMGFTMLREPKEVAMSMSSQASQYTPPSDLAVITSAQTTAKISDPRKVKYLKVKLSGFTDKAQIVSDARQKAAPADDGKSAVYEINARDFDAKRSVSLPIKDAKLKDFLAEGAYIQPSDSKIKAAAEQIVGDEKNAYKAALLIRDWVAANMKTSGTIGVVRSSTEILNTRTGVCRDYATLYTALARAAGIPTKIVTGMMYWNDGLYYHAWAESFVGEWVPFDATLDSPFVDATHIKLDEGDALAMFRMVKAVGMIKAEVLEYR